MPTNRDLAAVLDIHQAAQKVLRYQQGLEQVEFLDDDIDLGEVWKTATSDIPALINQLSPILP